MSWPSIIFLARIKVMNFLIHVMSAYWDKQVAALFFSVKSYVGKANPHKLLVKIVCPKELNIGIHREENRQTEIAWKLSVTNFERILSFSKKAWIK